ncbi:MAG: endonuclease/exonuclease/phosphatase family protein [Clostridia bacterium]|nr:endonuclease/exonuclease/phosphatase family protein [Clostridia bacterium]
MKRLLILLVAVTSVFLLFSCGVSQMGEDTTEVTEPTFPVLTICGVDISEFTIVYESSSLNGEKELAASLSEHIFDNYGVRLSVIGDNGASAKHMILIGKCKHVSDTLRVSAITLEGYKLNPANSMLYTAEGHLWVICSGPYNSKAAVSRLISDITPDNGKSLNIDYSTGVNVVCEELGEEMRIMSYNVQTGTASKVTPRVANVVKNITDFDADIIGTQEVNYIWLDELQKLGFFDTYTRVGEAREGDKQAAGNEYSCIFFKTDKFNLIDSGTYWLSETPEEISKLTDCDYYRIMTFALLERKSDGVRFLHVNTHLEWDHGTVETNLMQVDIMLELTDELLKKHGDMPVFFTGDFNTKPTTKGYARMLEWGCDDARTVADSTSKSDTHSGGSIIDYCFVSKDDFVVTSFRVGKGYAGSDHYPVFVRSHLIKK